MIESRPVDRQPARHQVAWHQDHSSQRGSTRRAVLSRPWEQLNGTDGSGSRWKQSYGGERSDSHRWLRFR